MIVTVDGLRQGQLVRSIAGRDKGQYYLIWDFIGDKYIEVVDGIKHPVNKPKKKNLKHVRVTMVVATQIEEAILKSERITDSQIATAIKERINELEEGDRFHG
ncbi:MAG TPA: KOW domain-containing RNA-binding protein [Bacillota bacterium]|jgi:ribosomal protein L14E/L6E/L27E|nr:KOW domain-containing RNA-binding protein [Bacillota bacterium]HOL08985.1 KOW domain-containing RNA-binding protein [Bacillota bacterium]HPO96461.1 KOW domain-containing RNA-binding protein [Bacillota bacterium]